MFNKKITMGISALCLSLMLPMEAQSQEAEEDFSAGCAVLRIKTSLPQPANVSAESRAASLCTPSSASMTLDEAVNGVRSEPEPVAATIPEPTQETFNAWVDFYNLHCNVGGQVAYDPPYEGALSGFDSIYNNPARVSSYDRCNKGGNYSSLPDPAFTTLYQMVELKNQPYDSLYGFSLVEHMEGGIYIDGTPNLKTLEGLDNVKSMRGVFNGYNTGLVSLKGLENLETVRYFALYGNTSLTDISALSSLTSFEWLYLQANNITDISALSGIQSGTRLNLSANKITSFAPLSWMVNMDDVNISTNLNTDFTGLDNLTSVTGTLEISNRNVTSFKGLENLRSVGTFNFLGSQWGGNITLDDVSAINNIETGHFRLLYVNTSPDAIKADYHGNFCRKWREKDGVTVQLSNYGRYDFFCSPSEEESQSGWLGFANTYCIHRDPYGSVAEISSAGLSCYNEYTGFLPSANELVNITNLNLSGNRLTELTGLNALQSVANLLSLRSNQLTNLDGLTSLTSVNNLWVDYNDLTNVDGLAGLNTVNDLYLSQNELVNVDGLSGLTTVNDLTLSYNQLSSIYGLRNLTSANYLSLSNNNLADLSPLSNLTSVGSLTLSNNPLIVNLKGIDNIASATSINLTTVSRNITQKISSESPFCQSWTNGLLGTVSLDSGVTQDDICGEEYVEPVAELDYTPSEEALYQEWIQFFAAHCTYEFNGDINYFKPNHTYYGNRINCSNRGITNDMMPARWISGDNEEHISTIVFDFSGNNLTHTDNFRGMYHIYGLDLGNNNITSIEGLTTIGYSVWAISIDNNPLSSFTSLGRPEGAPPVLSKTSGEELTYSSAGQFNLQNTPFCNTEANWYHGACNRSSTNPAIQ